MATSKDAGVLHSLLMINTYRSQHVPNLIPYLVQTTQGNSTKTILVCASLGDHRYDPNLWDHTISPEVYLVFGIAYDCWKIDCRMR